MSADTSLCARTTPEGAEVEAWDYDKHAPMIAAWARARDLGSDAGPRELYPRTGFVVGGCVVGFLYLTDAPKVAQVGSVVSNPKASRTQRTAAIAELGRRLVAAADEHGIELLVTSTSHPRLIAACESNGFREFGTGQTCLVRVRKAVEKCK